MMQNNNESASLEKCGSFCSDCKLILNSIYSIGTASSLNECVQSTNKEIINKNNETFNQSEFFFFCKNKLPSPVPYIKDENSVTSQTEARALFDKELKKGKRVSEEFKEMCIPHNYKKCSTCVKPIIIEDKILQSSEKLQINNWKRPKSQISNYESNDPKDSVEHYTRIITDHKRHYQNITNDCINLKNVYKKKRQSRQLTQIDHTEVPTHSQSQNIKHVTHTPMETDYLSQYHTLKSTILNRRKRIAKVAQNLLTLSTCLDGICKTILETKESNPNFIRPNISSNLSEKVDKSTSPTLVSTACPTVINLPDLPEQEKIHDMYSYNPYRSKNILQKKI